MSVLHRGMIVINAVCTIATMVSLVPVALIYPCVAEALASAEAGSQIAAIGRDALLCFGPLAVPFFLVLGAAALRSAWLREPAALRLNGSALAMWGATAAGITLAVAR